MRRRVLFILILLVSVSMPLLAAWGDPMIIKGEVTVNPFSRLFDFLENIIFGVAAGALVMAKFFVDLLRSYWRSDESDSAMRKAVMRLLTTVLIATLAGGAILYITLGK